jgi:hypothetical protein
MREKIKKIRKKKIKPVRRYIYGILNRDSDGVLSGLCDVGIQMKLTVGHLYLWDTPPNHYFNPERGDFMVKADRSYKDIEFLHKLKGNARNTPFNQLDNKL